MSKIFYLSKIFFLEQFSTIFSKVSSRKRATNTILVAIVSLLVMFSLGVSSFGQYIALKEIGRQEFILYYGLVYVGIFSLAFFFFDFQNTFLGARDYEFLAGLPLKSYEIIGGKLISILMISYFVQIIILLPMIILFLMGNALTIGTIVFLIIGFLLMPMFNFLLSALFGLFVNYFSKKSASPKRAKQNLSYLFIFILVILFLIINFAGLNNIMLGESLPLIMHILLPIQSLLFFTITQSSWLLFLAYVFLNLFFAYLTASLLAKNYFKFNQKTSKEKVRKQNKPLFQQTSVLKNLFSFEVRQYFSKPLYVFNTAFSGAFMLIASIALPIAFIVMLKNPNGLPAVFSQNTILVMLTSFVLVSLALLSCSSCSSVSIEGRSFYYKKSLPIKFKVQMFAKVLVNLMLSIPFIFCFLTTLPIMIYLKFYFLDVIMLLFLILTSHLLVANMGLFINLMFIKLDWINETVVIKQSISVFLTMLISILIIFASIFVITKVLAFISITLILLLLNIVYVLLAILFWYLITTIGQKKYNQTV